jgi:hypothetical protein
VSARFPLLVAVSLTVVACGGNSVTGTSFSAFDVSGTVRTTAFVPIEGAQVQVVSGVTSGQATTDAQGHYVLPKLQGNLITTAWKPGFFPGYDEFNARNGHSDYQLQPEPSIETGQTIPAAIGLITRASDPTCGAFDVFTCVCLRWAPTISGPVEMSLTWIEAVELRGAVLTTTDERSTPSTHPPGSAAVIVNVTAGTVYEVRVTASGSTGLNVTLTQR